MVGLTLAMRFVLTMVGLTLTMRFVLTMVGLTLAMRFVLNHGRSNSGNAVCSEPW